VAGFCFGAGFAVGIAFDGVEGSGKGWNGALRLVLRPQSAIRNPQSEINNEGWPS
jgi:hypothetical protein